MPWPFTMPPTRRTKSVETSAPGNLASALSVAAINSSVAPSCWRACRGWRNRIPNACALCGHVSQDAQAQQHSPVHREGTHPDGVLVTVMADCACGAVDAALPISAKPDRARVMRWHCDMHTHTQTHAHRTNWRQHCKVEGGSITLRRFRWVFPLLSVVAECHVSFMGAPVGNIYIYGTF